VTAPKVDFELLPGKVAAKLALLAANQECEPILAYKA